MGTLRRDVTRMFGAIAMMFGFARGSKSSIPLSKAEPKAPDPSWLEEAKRTYGGDALFMYFGDTLRGFERLKALARPVRTDSLLHYVHKGHRHAAARRLMWVRHRRHEIVVAERRLGAGKPPKTASNRDPGDEQHDEFDAAFLLQDYATAKAR